MKKENAVERMVEETLQSLDGTARAEAPPFFYTRLQAKMENLAEEKNSWGWISKPAFSFAVVALLLVLNVAAVVSYLGKDSGSNAPVSGLQNFAQEYDLDGSYVYNDKSAH